MLWFHSFRPTPSISPSSGSVLPGLADMVAPMTLPLRSERLELRQFNDDDLDALLAMQGNEEMTRYLPWGPQSRDEVLRLLERIKAMTATHPSSDGVRLAAVLPDSRAVVGDFSLWRTNSEHAQGEIGFVVHPDHQRLGYATEACTALLRLGFEHLGMHRIVGRADARNVASIGVMERLGMRREAHLRENELIKGEWTDEVIFAALAHEWSAPG
jgi:RimJ/RimL family protein N-acetyltransferase